MGRKGDPLTEFRAPLERDSCEYLSHIVSFQQPIFQIKIHVKYLHLHLQVFTLRKRIFIFLRSG